jgi:putative protease
VNNPGHFSFFRGTGEALLVAGPWLYSFNGWAAAFLANQGADYAVTPLENNRQNLEKTWGRCASRVFVSLFAQPPLFRIRDAMNKRYGFRLFSGSRDEHFSLVCAEDVAGAFSGRGETVVTPETPFSLVDKRPFLEAAGFRRFILDFSGGVFSGSFPLKKYWYKDIITAAREGTPLAGTSRFNWKNGFFQNQPEPDGGKPVLES